MARLGFNRLLGRGRKVPFNPQRGGYGGVSARTPARTASSATTGLYGGSVPGARAAAPATVPSNLRRRRAPNRPRMVPRGGSNLNKAGMNPRVVSATASPTTKVSSTSRFRDSKIARAISKNKVPLMIGGGIGVAGSWTGNGTGRSSNRTTGRPTGNTLY